VVEHGAATRKLNRADLATSCVFTAPLGELASPGRFCPGELYRARGGVRAAGASRMRDSAADRCRPRRPEHTLAGGATAADRRKKRRR